MKVDRRRFIELGALSVFAGNACGGGSEQHGAGQPSAIGLTIDFEGLYLVESKGSSMVVHIVDAPAVGLPTHVGQLKAVASQIDQSKTQKPDPSHIIPAGNDEFWLWDLQGNQVTTPPAPGGSDDLSQPAPTTTEDTQDTPSTVDGWNSLFRLPDLKVCCGATKIQNAAAIASSIYLTHGRLAVLRPTDVVGNGAVWKFTNPATGQQLLRGALSNKVQYSCPAGDQPLFINVGTQKIVFKPSAQAQVTVDNTPSVKPPPCSASCMPTMSHFKALCKIVDSTFEPTIELAKPFVPGSGFDAGADYCPGGRP
ncbi:MAG TPA: hypothetical protein VKE96_10905 [Vicinamibacterales bacterium]|nr:hypothetical protein [Vicinamibacterales bacterium]